MYHDPWTAHIPRLSFFWLIYLSTIKYETEILKHWSIFLGGRGVEDACVHMKRFEIHGTCTTLDFTQVIISFISTSEVKNLTSGTRPGKESQWYTWVTSFRQTEEFLQDVWLEYSWVTHTSKP